MREPKLLASRWLFFLLGFRKIIYGKEDSYCVSSIKLQNYLWFSQQLCEVNTLSPFDSWEIEAQGFKSYASKLQNL